MCLSNCVIIFGVDLVRLLAALHKFSDGVLALSVERGECSDECELKLTVAEGGVVSAGVVVAAGEVEEAALEPPVTDAPHGEEDG